jgi:hypothetical protein
VKGYEMSHYHSCPDDGSYQFTIEHLSIQLDVSKRDDGCLIARYGDMPNDFLSCKNSNEAYRKSDLWKAIFSKMNEAKLSC